MFGGAHELKGNGSFCRKEATKTVACSESPYTIADVHECRLAENGGAGLATTVPRSLDSGWDKSIEFYIKKEY
nr:IQ motif, EF-hand binding site-containing protein [Tanacetum cinerariifolium]